VFCLGPVISKSLLFSIRKELHHEHWCVGARRSLSVLRGRRHAQTVYSFEARQSIQDGFVPNGVGVAVTQDTIERLTCLILMKVCSVGGATFVGPRSRASYIRGSVTPPCVNSILFDMTCNQKVMLSSPAALHSCVTSSAPRSRSRVQRQCACKPNFPISSRFGGQGARKRTTVQYRPELGYAPVDGSSHQSF